MEIVTMWHQIIEWAQSLKPSYSSGYPAVGLQMFPYLLGFMLVEVMLYTKVTKRDFPRLEFLSSLVLGIGYGFSSIIPLIVYAGAYVWLWEHRFYTIDLNTYVQWAILFVAGDFMYYWSHRFAHRCKWFWSVHAVHHSPSQMYFAVAFQLPWTSFIAPQIIFWAPLVLVGFHPGAVLFSLKVNLIFQFFLHTEIIRKLPKPIEYFFNTPSHHRAHHASNAEYLDKNYGGLLIVWDRLFGTFKEEDQAIAIKYGLVHPHHSKNPLIISFYPIFDLLRNSAKVNGIIAKIKFLFSAPEFDVAYFNGVATERDVQLLKTESSKDVEPKKETV